MKTLPIADHDPQPILTRIGASDLTRLAFTGSDLAGKWNEVLARYRANPADAAALLDLSVLAQLMSDPQAGANLQAAALNNARLFRSPTAQGCAEGAAAGARRHDRPRWKHPARIPAPGRSDIELVTLYVPPRFRPSPIHYRRTTLPSWQSPLCRQP